MMRLDKLLAHAGYGTRKEVKALIKAKQVTVNGINALKDKQQIDEFQDEVFVCGEKLVYAQNHFIMMNKPAGVICANRDDYHETIMDLFDCFIGTDMFPVGRLDIDTEGLLLICNDGKLAHRLLSPKHHVDKCYEVHLAKEIDAAQVQKLSSELDLGDFISKPAQIEVITPTCIHMVIQEGKYHQVKRMLQAVDNEVVYLKRLRFGPLSLDESLSQGEWRYLTKSETDALYAVK